MKKVFKYLFGIIIGILILLILTTACVQLIYYREKENISVSSLNFIAEDNPVYLTAHRGVTAFAPENSLPAFEKAAEMKYYAAECDILFTKDNVWVLTHDNTMFLHFWSFKNVSENNYSDLKKITYKNGVNFLKHDIMYLPTLDEYLDVLKDTETKAQIEIKTEGTEGLAEVLQKLEERQMKEKSMIISFNIEQLIFLRELDNEIELWYLTEEINDTVLENCKKLGANSKLAIKAKEIPDEKIKTAQQQGVDLAAWTVNDEKTLERVYKLGIKYITTDVYSN